MTAQDHELSAALGWPGGIGDPVLDRAQLLRMVAALRLASQQALEALEYENSWHESFKVRPYASTIDAITALRAALAQQDEPVKPAPLKRGITGRCTRKVCECEKEGLGPECIYLEPVIDGYPLWSGIPKAEPVEPVAALIAQRDALLEALRSIADCCDEEHAARDYASRQAEIRGIARAVIKMVEETK